MKGFKRGLKRWQAFDYVNALLLLLLVLITVYPFYNVLLISLNDPVDTLKGGLSFYVRKFTFENYEYFFSQNSFLRAFTLSVSRTVIGALTSVLFTAAFSYGLSKRRLIGRKFLTALMVIPMYVSGGLIPTFLVIQAIGLYQNFWVYIIPALFSSYNAILMITYFKSIPGEIEESVAIDGGSDLTTFFRIIIPISMPIFATITLFNAVAQWNSWFDTMLYGGRELITLQAKLVEIIRDVDAARKMASSGDPAAVAMATRGFKPTVESVKATAMVVTAVPIIMVYPFLQRYFVKGVMIGSLKG